LKSSSANLGALGLAEMCSALETLAQAGTLDDATSARVQALSALHTQVLAALTQAATLRRAR
jgi:hypothetical protein